MAFSRLLGTAFADGVVDFLSSPGLFFFHLLATDEDFSSLISKDDSDSGLARCCYAYARDCCLGTLQDFGMFQTLVDYGAIYKVESSPGSGLFECLYFLASDPSSLCPPLYMLSNDNKVSGDCSNCPTACLPVMTCPTGCVQCVSARFLWPAECTVPPGAAELIDYIVLDILDDGTFLWTGDDGVTNAKIICSGDYWLLTYHAKALCGGVTFSWRAKRYDQFSGYRCPVDVDWEYIGESGTCCTAVTQPLVLTKIAACPGPPPPCPTDNSGETAIDASFSWPACGGEGVFLPAGLTLDVQGDGTWKWFLLGDPGAETNAVIYCDSNYWYLVYTDAVRCGGVTFTWRQPRGAETRPGHSWSFVSETGVCCDPGRPAVTTD